jgi:hypothetical protein
VQKCKKEYVAVPRFLFDLCIRIGCHVAMAMSPSAEHPVLGTGSSWFHAETTGEFNNSPLGLLQSLLGLLYKSYCESTLFQEALGVLRVSHISGVSFIIGV